MKWWWVRRLANWVNLSTMLGLVIAKVGRAELTGQGQGLWLATGYRFGFPVARAFTIGSVVITKYTPEWMAERPRLFGHESKHATQWACCMGLPFLPLYVVAMLWSVAWSGDRGSHNVFEVLAGLEEGGYQRRPTRFSRRTAP
jgi:hypothetical protein